MKLIRNLPTKIINGRVVSYGIFWCEDCKQEVEKRLGNGLRYKSCGCYKIKHSESHTKLYRVWHDMKQRILNSNNKFYKDYGDRGIAICPEWTDKENGYINFRDWSLNNGYKEGLFIDRKNPNGNYETSNCRWITVLESNRNKTNTITMEIANEIRFKHNTGNYTQKELAKKFNASQRTISYIINNKIWKT